MLKGPINVGKKYIWNPPGDNAYNLEVVPMAVLTVLAIHSYTTTNRTWIEFKDDQGNRTSMDAARFRQGCLETNQYIGKIETIMNSATGQRLFEPTFGQPISQTPEGITFTIFANIPADKEEELLEGFKQDIQKTLGSDYDITRTLEHHYHIKKKI